MQKGEVCDNCNSRFSKFESDALANSIFVMERARLAIESKKGKAAKGKVKEIGIEGDSNFTEGLITVSGLSEDNFRDFNPITREGKLYIKTFDKNEVSASKLFLKIGLESIYKSQRKLYNNFDFTLLTNYLTGVENIDWPFICTDSEQKDFKSVPTFTDKHRLNKTPCKISFLAIDNETLLFKFQYGGSQFIINLINRNLGWIKDFMKSDCETEVQIEIYPEHYKEKFKKRIVNKQ